MAVRLTPLSIVLVLAAVAAIVVALWMSDRRADRAEREIGLDAARTLSETFAKSRDLRVATLRGEVIAKGSDPGFAQLLPSSLTVKYPYRIDYFVDLRRIDVDAYRWDAATRTMTVRIPDVVPAPPAVDAARADPLGTTGLLMTRGAAQRLNRTVASRAALRAAESGRKPEHLDRARAAAREAMQDLVAAPLRVAGLADVTVTVRFPWELLGDGVVVRWDESRSLDEVYAGDAPGR